MNKPELVKEFASRLETTQVAAAEILDVLYGILEDFFAEGGDTFRLGNLGTLKVKQRAARNIRNIHTKEMVEAPAHLTVTFSPSPSLRTALNDNSDITIKAA